ncbi:hypothetical protein [Adhaeretor mobilis]|uniref:PEP-CTERM sorting domain-containing protein n=1 Tax=Adhaeretor mobilis TaxID=1930276 RepID=A0A517MW43_9BACT|nr:hypothetical protein [Adhaeretor mobilis]QDS99089.1 hypothetical protein HG15A2_23790 [Adhaeretor mobilis]
MSINFGSMTRGFGKNWPKNVCKVVGGVSLLAVLLVSVNEPQVARAAIIDATLIEDTYLEAPQDVNYSSEEVLKFRTFRSVWRNPLIQFELPVLPTGQQVVGAELILTSAQDTKGEGGTPDIEVLATATPIDMATVTHENSNPTLHTGGQPFVSRLLWTGLVGDFNSDGIVEGTDFLLWQRNARGSLSDWEANYASPNPPRVWSDFSTESVIAGEDFTTGQVVNYADNDGADGMLKFVQDNISGSTAVIVNFGLGFVSREGEDGTTSVGWNIHSSEGAGNAPILRLTTEVVPASAIPEPIGGLLLAFGLMALSAVRFKTN